MNKPTVVTAVAATVALAVFATARPASDDVPATVPHLRAAEPATRSRLAGDPTADPSTTRSAPAEEERQIVFPDGSKLPPLNGVEVPAPMEWPGERPYSPVVRRMRDQRGREWYIHADGSRTSTWMEWRKDLGRYDAVTVVDNPVAGTPVPIHHPR